MSYAAPSDAVLERAFLDDALIDAAWHAAGALAAEAVDLEEDAPDPGEGLRRLVRLFGERGLLRLLAPAKDGGALERVSWRAVCLARERLGHASPLAELAFAMQGLGSYPCTSRGTDAQRARFLAPVLRGDAVAAFALTEPDAGSDLSRLATRATRDGTGFVLDGHKVLISNAGVADLYTVFAVTDPGASAR